MKESIRFLRPFYRGLPLIILSVVIAVLIAKKYLSYVTPEYESTVKIKLADLTQGISNNNLFKDLDVFASSNKIAAEIELMKSDILLEKVIDKLQISNTLYRVGELGKKELYQNAPILIQAEGTPANIETFLISIQNDSTYSLRFPGSDNIYSSEINDTILLKQGFVCASINSALFKLKPETDLFGLYEYEINDSKKAIENVKSNLDVLSVEKDVPVVSIIYKSSVPQKSADVVNQLAQEYIRDYIESKYKAAETTVEFLDDRINEVSNDLSQSESKIETYKNGRRIVNLQQESETDLRKIAQLKIQLSNLKISLDALSELEDDLRSDSKDFLLKAPNFQAYTDLLSTELIKKIKQLQAKRRDLLLTYTPSNEQILVIDDKLEDLIVYLIEGVSNSKKNIGTKFNQLQIEIKEAESFFDGYATKQKDLNVMNRDFNIYETSYNFLNEKRIEAEIARAAKISFHRIISPASPSSKPVSPNSIIIILVTALLALIGSIGLIYMVHGFKGKVNDEYTIEQKSDFKVAVKTPYLKDSKSQDIHFMREAIQLELKGITSNNPIICFSSDTNNEGRLFHIKGLAKAFNKQGRKVLVFCCNGIGLSQEIESRDLSGDNFRSMSQAQMYNYVDALRENYDLILIDNEPMFRERIGLMMMCISTKNLYVVDTQRTPAVHIENTNLLCDEFGIQNISFILNRHLYNPSVLTIIPKVLKRLFSRNLTKKKVA